MVDGVVGAALAREDDLRDGDEGVSLLEEALQDRGQGLGRMEGGVVEEDDRAGLYLARDPLGDLGRGEVLPVQTVTVPNGFKAGLDMLPMGRALLHAEEPKDADAFYQ